VRLTYRSEAGSEWVTGVDPWAVVVRHGRWYLLCHSHSAGARRAYRVDRVRDVEPLADSFVPPADLDPVAMLEEHLAVGWEYEAEVLIDAPIETLLRRVPPPLGRLQAVDEETTRLVGSTSNPWWYAENLAALPAPFRVVGGPELRQTVTAVGRRMLAATGEPAD
jgi:predicted DNA-binding transcriptional regulator YafY